MKGCWKLASPVLKFGKSGVEIWQVGCWDLTIVLPKKSDQICRGLGIA